MKVELEETLIVKYRPFFLYFLKYTLIFSKTETTQVLSSSLIAFLINLTP
jgi:hypothetical protein